MMSVAPVHAAPAVDHNVRAKSADHEDHVLEDLVAPDPFRFLRRLRIAKIFGSRKVQPHAVAPCCRQQFLRPEQSQLRRLFGAKIVLPALAARQGEQRDIRMQPAGKIGQHRSAFIVRMSRHVEDARGNPSALDRLDGFRQAGPCPRRWRKLCQARYRGFQNHACKPEPKKETFHTASTPSAIRVAKSSPCSACNFPLQLSPFKSQILTADSTLPKAPCLTS